MEVAGGETKILNTPEQIKSISHIPELNGFIFKDAKGGILFYDSVDVQEISSPEPVNLISHYISKLNGVLLRGTKGAILYFDGLKIEKIPSPFTRQNIMRSWRLIEVATFEEDENRSNDERIFLYIYRGKVRKPNLVTEFKAGLLLEPVSFPQEINYTVNFFRFPDDSLFWAIVHNFGILAEIDGKFQNIVTVPEPNTMSWKFPLTAPISFKVENSLTNKSEQYYLKKASPSANCEIRLDPDNPVKLTVD